MHRAEFPDLDGRLYRGLLNQSRPSKRPNLHIFTEETIMEQHRALQIAEYELPFRADDLKPGERLSTRQHAAGAQGLGKDITVMRHLGGTEWASTHSNSSTSSNGSSLIYGKPFYAMAAGVVVAGWRNAPDNPGPGQTHPERATGRIGGGGNSLWILQDDGVMALYAHARPGTIPHQLVPIDAELLSGPKEDSSRFHPESIVPEQHRARVEKGQFLGEVGNSGRSSGPHLHVHMEVGKSADGHGQATAHPMRFARGLATPRTAHTADIDAWASFAHHTIPDGSVLIWPPRTVGEEYARHGFDPAAFSRLFSHLQDSGYQPEWFDAYRVADQVYYNFVWRPAHISWRFWRDQTSDSYNTKVNAAFGEGFSPTHVESYLNADGQPRYAVVVVKDNATDVLARHGLSSEGHRSAMADAQQAGLSPVSVSVVSSSGHLRYTVLYRAVDIGRWAIQSRIPADAFQSKFNQMRDEGLAPHYVAAYMHQGQAFFSVIFAARSNNGRTTDTGSTPSSTNSSGPRTPRPVA